MRPISCAAPDQLDTSTPPITLSASPSRSICLKGFPLLSTNDLGDFLDREVYPALFDRLDGAFREYGFKRKGHRWEATDANASRSLPGQPRPDRVNCYVNRPWGLVIQGGDFVRFLDLVSAERMLTL